MVLRGQGRQDTQIPLGDIRPLEILTAQPWHRQCLVARAASAQSVGRLRVSAARGGAAGLGVADTLHVASAQGGRPGLGELG